MFVALILLIAAVVGLFVYLHVHHVTVKAALADVKAEVLKLKGKL